MTEEERQDQMSEHRAYYLGVPVTASAVLAPLFYLLSLHFSLNCAVVYALGLFLLGVLYITPIRVKKPQLAAWRFCPYSGLANCCFAPRIDALALPSLSSGPVRKVFFLGGPSPFTFPIGRREVRVL